MVFYAKPLSACTIALSLIGSAQVAIGRRSPASATFSAAFERPAACWRPSKSRADVRATQGHARELLVTAAQLSDEALLSRLKAPSIRERDATVELVAHLAELDARRLHLREGPGSIYKYCRDALGYSEDAAWNRAATASAVRRYPVILGWLADGTLNVTTVRILKSVLTADNHVSVLTEARRRSKREVELIEARLNPKPDVPSSIRKMPVPPDAVPVRPGIAGFASDCSRSATRAEERTSSGPTALGPGASEPTASMSSAPGGEVRVAPPARAVIAPLTPERYQVKFTVSKETHDKLRHLQDLLCREVPDGDPAVIFDRALDVLTTQVEKKKLAVSTRPRAARPGSGLARHAADVRRVSGRVTRGSARSSAEAGAVPSAGSSNCTMSSRSAIRARPRSRTSPCGAAPTTSTRASWCLGVSHRAPIAPQVQTRLFPGKSRRSGTAEH